VSRWPYLGAADYTLWDAASGYSSQIVFLLVGLLNCYSLCLLCTPLETYIFT